MSALQTGGIAFTLVLPDISVERCPTMNREELRAQIQAAAFRLTDELVEYFGEMLQSVVKDVTVGVAEAKPLRKAAPPPAPRPAPKKAAPKKVASKKVKVAPKAVKKVAAKAAKKVAPKKVAKQVAKPAPKKAAKKVAKPIPKKSGRRSNKELDQAADVVVKFLKEQGREMRIEEINKALGTSTRELMRPIKKLLANKKIQKRGERRSTTYFAS